MSPFVKLATFLAECGFSRAEKSRADGDRASRQSSLLQKGAPIYRVLHQIPGVVHKSPVLSNFGTWAEG